MVDLLGSDSNQRWTSDTDKLKLNVMDALADELTKVMRCLTQGHDVLPFMDRRTAVADLALKPLPEEMGRLLAQSVDYMSPQAGEGPVWLRLEGPHEGAEMIVYRAMADKVLYVVAPTNGLEGPPSRSV